MSESSGWFNVLVVHRGDRSPELELNAFDGSATFDGVAFKASGVAELLRALAKDRHVELLKEFREGEEQDPFSDDDLPRWQDDQIVSTFVTAEVIYRKGDVHALAQAFEVMGEALDIERIGMIEVHRIALVCGEVAKVFVVTIERQDRYSILPQSFCQLMGESALARTTAPGYADSQRSHSEKTYSLNAQSFDTAKKIPSQPYVT